MTDFFEANPHKAAAKIGINSSLMAVCLALFTIMWTFAPEKINVKILLQIILAVPLFYISSISYTKIAYWKQVRHWDRLGWLTGNAATAFTLNLIGILTFLLGYSGLALMYFGILWTLLIIYTLINIRYNPKAVKIKVFKLLFFIVIQLIFVNGLLYFY